jgi:hypothetical protein
VNDADNSPSCRDTVIIRGAIPVLHPVPYAWETLPSITPNYHTTSDRSQSGNLGNVTVKYEQKR